MALAISCSSQPLANNDIKQVNEEVLNLVQNGNFREFSELISKRTTPLINENLLKQRFTKAQKLLKDFPDSSKYRIEVSQGKMSAQSVFGEVDYIQVTTVLDSVQFHEDTFETSIELKFIEENKILTLNILDGKELVVLQRHLKHLKQGEECEADCPFHNK